MLRMCLQHLPVLGCARPSCARYCSTGQLFLGLRFSHICTHLFIKPSPIRKPQFDFCCVYTKHGFYRPMLRMGLQNLPMLGCAGPSCAHYWSTGQLFLGLLFALYAHISLYNPSPIINQQFDIRCVYPRHGFYIPMLWMGLQNWAVLGCAGVCSGWVSKTLLCKPLGNCQDFISICFVCGPFLPDIRSAHFLHLKPCLAKPCLAESSHWF